MSETPQKPARNALAHETSPYLLQHAHNPVDWYPWGETALEVARRLDKPILLSIGYSACHWCHVMAHESFEDEDTARVMNQYFVNIKVDREERPDLDKIYQLAHQLLTQRAGGWPLTMFLTPEDLTPFFGGTYFPPIPRHGMPAFRDLLLRVVDFLANQRAEVLAQNASLRDALIRAEGGNLAPGGSVRDLALDDRPLGAAREQLENMFDPVNGGFGRAPKFPHPTNTERLLRHYAACHLRGEDDSKALHIVTHTLHRMAYGGIYDHVGGGFCRYSVDEKWMIPHFEKMLYDNGPLIAQYAEAWQLTGEPHFARVAKGIGEWVIREMQAPEGGYYSSLDADSEGEEGKFYLWSPELVRRHVDDAQYEALARCYGLDGPPNFEQAHWHLHTFTEPPAAAASLDLTESELLGRLDRGLAKLFVAREPRIRPGRDEKILGSWNALMIKGMATAGRILDEPALVDSAERASAFLREKLWVDGRLLATYKDGRAHLSAYLDDYAFQIDALLALLTLRWRRADLDWALELAEILLAQFEDQRAGGFFFTANDHEQLLHRSKSFMDDALPAGNAVACQVLGRLAHLVGDTRYLETVERALRAAWPALGSHPHAHNALLNALEEHLDPPQTIILRGSGPELEQWRHRTLRSFAPRRLVLAIPDDAGALPGLLQERTGSGRCTAYVCEGHHCKAPIAELAELETVLQASEITPG